MSGMTLSEQQTLYAAIAAAPSVVAPVRRPFFGRQDETEGARPAQQTASKAETTLAAIERKLIATLIRQPALLADASGLESVHFGTVGLDVAFEALREAKSGDLDLLRHRWSEKRVSGAVIEAILGSPVANAEDVGALSGAVRDAHRERCIAAAALAIHETPADPKAHEVMREALEQASGTDAPAFVGTKTSSEDFKADFERRKAGEVRMIQTGLVDLDRQVGGGFTEGQMVVVSARPGKGKTTLVMQAAEHVAHRFPEELVVVVSLEMPRVQLTRRRVAAASDGRLTVHQLKNPGGLMAPEDFPIVDECLAKLAPNVEVCDRASQDIDSLVASIRDMAGRHKVALVVVDYLQLVQTKSASKSDTREQAVSRVSRALKLLALDIGCPVLVVAQMSRDIEKSVTGRRPVLADLRESGAIEQDADIVIFLHADADLDSTAERKPVEAIVAKARDGGEGIVGLVFHGAWGRFENLAPSVLAQAATAARPAVAVPPRSKGGTAAQGAGAARVKAFEEAKSERQTGQGPSPADGLDLFAL